MLQTKYITLDDFRNYFVDVDLRQQLGSEEKAVAFLKRIEDRIATFIDSNFNRNIEFEYPNFTDYQKKHYKLALLEQAIYIFRNGDISVDSGADTDKGIIIDIAKIERLSICNNAIQNLRLCGVWNRNIRGRLIWL